MTSSGWLIVTGTKPDGAGQVGYRVGDTKIMMGKPDVLGKELGETSVVTTGTGTNVDEKTVARPLYGISPLLTVGQPPPVSPYAPVWFATLTVDKVDRFHGCDNRITNRDDCSKRGVLEYRTYFYYDPEDLAHAEHGYYGEVGHTVQFLEWDSGANLLRLSLNNRSGEAAKAALSGLTLNVVDSGDSYALAISDAGIGSTFIQWPLDPRHDWTDGQKVFLSLTLSGRQPAPPRLNGLRAVSQDGAVWSDLGRAGRD